MSWRRGPASRCQVKFSVIVEVERIGRTETIANFDDGDPDPISAGTAGDAARWGGSIAVVGMAAIPLGAHQAG